MTETAAEAPTVTAGRHTCPDTSLTDVQTVHGVCLLLWKMHTLTDTDTSRSEPPHVPPLLARFRPPPLRHTRA